MKRIIIIEDDFSMRKELEELLNNSGYETIIFDDFENLKEKILEEGADLILLDINIPILNGEQLLKELRKESEIPIIMVTSRNNEADEVLSMSYGADDYITKPYNPTILLLRISNIFKRSEKITEVTKYRNLEINFKKGTISNTERKIVLTKNEMIIFSCLISKKGEIVTRDELMIELWNNDECINDNALTVNISRLRAKLKKLDNKESIETRKGLGYILL